MRPGFNVSALRELTFSEAAQRFVLGGLVTAGAGLIAREYGPGGGGLFLAFPALLAASLTLIAKHQKERKARQGLHGVIRGRKAAALDALGAVMGALGLVAFAIAIQRLAIAARPAMALAGATFVWFGIASALWWLRRNLLRRRPVRRPRILAEPPESLRD
jgi:hypothetical protein